MKTQSQSEVASGNIDQVCLNAVTKYFRKSFSEEKNIILKHSSQGFIPLTFYSILFWAGIYGPRGCSPICCKKRHVCVGGVWCVCVVCMRERERISLLFTRLYIQNFHQLTIILKTSEQGLKTILLRIVHIKTVNWEFLKKLKKLERGQIGPVQIYWWRQGNCTLLLLSDIFFCYIHT